MYWNGYYAEDAPGYVTDAIWMAIGEYRARDYVNGLNVGTYLPVSLPILLLGKSEIALSLWPLACSLLGVLSSIGLGSMMFGRAYGLIAGFLYATYPGDVFFSTVVMPDALQAGWVSCSLFLVALAHTSRQGSLILAAAGIAMGMCHLIRANDVIFVPVGLGAVVICSAVWKEEATRAVVRSCATYLAGIAVIYALEGIVYLWALGDFLHRIHVVATHYGTAASIAQAGLNTDPRTIPFSIFPPIGWWMFGWGPLSQDQAYHALLFCWALVSLPVGLAALCAARPLSGRRVAGFAIAALWFSWPLLYHQFGSQSLTTYVPMHRLSRHLVVYAPGAVFATVAGCYLISAAIRQAPPAIRRVALAVGCALLAVHLTFNWQGERIGYGAYQQIKGTYGRIRHHLPPHVRTITADPGDLAFFDFWLNPLGRLHVTGVPFSNVSRCEEITGGVVLTFSNPGWEGLNAAIIRETVERLPCLVRPPSNWRLLYDGYPEKVYLVAGPLDARS
jgi:hypothetical protein